MSYYDTSNTDSIRKRVLEKLKKNPLLMPLEICKLLDLNYTTHGRYVTGIKSRWKSHYQNEKGLISSIHHWTAYTFLYIEGKSRFRHGKDIIKAALAKNWIQTKAKNRWLLWKDPIGRLMWFETGRINLHVKKPGNIGRAFQLFCNAFSFTGLLSDFELEKCLENIRFKGAHYVIETGERLPKLKVELFHRSNGVVVKAGDKSHPTSYELEITYPGWGERNELLFNNLMQLLKGLLPSKLPGDIEEFKKTDRSFYTV